MKRNLLILLFVCSGSVFGQSQIFSDTSLFFIEQRDSLPVDLSPADLVELNKHLVNAITDFNLEQQRYTDSLNPKKKKRKPQTLKINVDDYFFKLIPGINKQRQLVVWINGDCKSNFTVRTHKKIKYDAGWKNKFTDGMLVADGGSCFIYLQVNLTLKRYLPLLMNGRS